MPEDDDLNFAAARPAPRRAPRRRLHHRRRRARLARPAARLRVFTAERIAYRNLLDGYEPHEAAADRQPVPRLDRRPDPHRRVRVGRPRRPGRAARLAWQDARLTHPATGCMGRCSSPGRRRRPRRADGRRVHRRRAVGDPAAVSRYAAAVRVGSSRAPGTRRRGGHGRALRRVRPPPLGARPEQRGVRRVRAHPQRRRFRLARSDRALPAAGTPTPTAPRSARSAAAWPAPVGVARRVDRPAAQPAGHDDRRASTASASTSSARRTVAASVA